MNNKIARDYKAQTGTGMSHIVRSMSWMASQDIDDTRAGARFRIRALAVSPHSGAVRHIYRGTTMFHRAFLASTVISALLLASSAFAEVPDQKLTPPPSRPIKVAFVISDSFTLIDIAGPMQTFNQAWLPEGKAAFEPFTVSETRAPVQSWHALKVTPDYTFDDAPDADIVVVGAQTGDDEKYLGYIRRMNAEGKLMLSFCTGASNSRKPGCSMGSMPRHTTTTSINSRNAFQKCISSRTEPGFTARR